MLRINYQYVYDCGTELVGTKIRRPIPSGVHFADDDDDIMYTSIRWSYLKQCEKQNNYCSQNAKNSTVNNSKIYLQIVFKYNFPPLINTMNILLIYHLLTGYNVFVVSA